MWWLMYVHGLLDHHSTCCCVMWYIWGSIHTVLLLGSQVTMTFSVWLCFLIVHNGSLVIQTPGIQTPRLSKCLRWLFCLSILASIFYDCSIRVFGQSPSILHHNSITCSDCWVSTVFHVYSFTNGITTDAIAFLPHCSIKYSGSSSGVSKTSSGMGRVWGMFSGIVSSGSESILISARLSNSIQQCANERAWDELNTYCYSKLCVNSLPRRHNYLLSMLHLLKH